MLKHFKQSDNSGFTIVEVMFVLAIAAMIMLIVFLAVPALQRNARNTQRKSDASRVSAALTDFVSNNNGVLPRLTPAATWTSDCNTIVSDAGTLGELNATLTCGAAVTTPPTAGATGSLTAGTGAIATALATGKDYFVLDEAAVCGVSGLTTAGQARQMALLYTVEGGGGYAWSCIQAN